MHGTLAIEKGHLDQEQKNLQLIKPITDLVIEEVFPTIEIQDTQDNKSMKYFVQKNYTTWVGKEMDKLF